MLRFLYSGRLGNLFAPTPEPIEIIFSAIYEGLSEKVQEIIDEGFDVNTKNSDQNSPLAAAAYYGRTNIIQMLINAGADVNLACRGGNTALHFASKNGHVMAVELLLENGADKHCVNGTGLSALHVAAVYGHHDTIIPMLIAKIDVNVQTVKGDSALHFALRSGHTACAALLLDSRADPGTLNELHQTPIQQCKTIQQREEFEKILDDRNIKLNKTSETKRAALLSETKSSAEEQTRPSLTQSTGSSGHAKTTHSKKGVSSETSGVNVPLTRASSESKVGGRTEAGELVDGPCHQSADEPAPPSVAARVLEIANSSVEQALPAVDHAATENVQHHDHREQTEEANHSTTTDSATVAPREPQNVLASKTSPTMEHKTRSGKQQDAASTSAQSANADGKILQSGLSAASTHTGASLPTGAGPNGVETERVAITAPEASYSTAQALFAHSQDGGKSESKKSIFSN